VFLYHLWLYSGPESSQVATDRASAALFSHLGLGLSLFFALSGFLLYRPFARALLCDSPWPDLRRYARNRWLRILPAYLVILVVLTVLVPGGQLRTPDGEMVLGSLRSDPELLLRNLALIHNLSPSSLLTGIGPAWSLTVELCFYVVLPLVAAGSLFARRLRRPRTHRWRRPCWLQRCSSPSAG
jgi:peptidoglycan/LPS O-acetylase OafA/YrhL